MSIQSVTAERCYTIAEIGACHQGSVETAKRMIDAAAWAGVDAAKGQKRCLDPGVLFTAEELGKPYAGPHSFGATYGEHRRALELSWDAHDALRDYAATRGIEYTVSVWDVVSAREAVTRGYPWLKIPSACAKWEALRSVVASGVSAAVVSTGGCSSRDVDKIAGAWLSSGPWFALLQCTSAYPAEPSDVDLRVIGRWYGSANAVGLSGHHRGIAIDMAAVALGARVLERHFTLDRTQRGTDHAAALEPAGLAKLVRDVRAVEAALGSTTKRLHESESATMAKLRTEVMQ